MLFKLSFSYKLLLHDKKFNNFGTLNKNSVVIQLLLLLKKPY